ncbi:MAG: hypothetical protein GC162_00820 [Planctomycetes bacterium]|nr:hypothetical protein [Planctomycetota bacterium]
MNNGMMYRCPAKVNLALSVGRPREDGMHPICSWMVTVSLHDDLTITPTAGGVEFDIDWANDALQPSAIDWPVESDLIAKAHCLMQQYVERPLPVAVKLRKRIPVGAGLAGGSSDGATMLRALNEEFNLGLGRDTLCEIASHLGSDVAFFFHDGSAIVRDIGQQVQPAPLKKPMHLTLILPPLHCNTGAVYRTFDMISPDAALRDVVIGGVPFNDLAEAACRVEPKLAHLRQRVEGLIHQPVHVTGSGAAMFVIAADAPDARRLADCITTGVGVPALAVHTL